MAPPPELGETHTGAIAAKLRLVGDLPQPGAGKALHSFEIELAVRRLRLAEQVQNERLQAMVDGITLAAEQVQDIRLELLEKGPEVSTHLAMLDVFVVFLLESGLPGRVLSLFARALMKPRVKLLKIVSAGPKTDTPPNIFSSHLREQYGRTAFREFRVEVNRQTYLAYSDVVRALADMSPSLQDDITAVAKAGREALQRPFADRELTKALDSPGVSILGAAHAFSRSHRYASAVHYSFMEFVLRSEVVPIGKIEEITSVETLDVGLRNIRERFKLLFEAVIWARLCGFARSGGTIIGSGNVGGFKGVDDRLLKYWKERFGLQIEAWVKQLMRDGLIFGHRMEPMRGAFEDESRLQQTSYLHRYFVFIVETLPVLPDFPDDPFFVRNPIVKVNP